MVVLMVISKENKIENKKNENKEFIFFYTTSFVCFADLSTFDYAKLNYVLFLFGSNKRKE